MIKNAIVIFGKYLLLNIGSKLEAKIEKSFNYFRIQIINLFVTKNLKKSIFLLFNKGFISLILVVDGQLLFSCNFDVDNCGGSQSPNGGINYYFTTVDLITLDTYSVTDVTSISI